MGLAAPPSMLPTCGSSASNCSAEPFGGRSAGTRSNPSGCGPLVSDRSAGASVVLGARIGLFSSASWFGPSVLCPMKAINSFRAAGGVATHPMATAATPESMTVTATLLRLSAPPSVLSGLNTGVDLCLDSFLSDVFGGQTSDATNVAISFSAFLPVTTRGGGTEPCQCC